MPFDPTIENPETEAFERECDDLWADRKLLAEKMRAVRAAMRAWFLPVMKEVSAFNEGLYDTPHLDEVGYLPLATGFDDEEIIAMVEAFVEGRPS
ncbi:MAG: hypothetical protein AAFR00_13665 [Pseudomonadota bacterium]